MTSALTIKSINIRDFEQRDKPKPHTVFRIEVISSVRVWTLFRRYTDFVDLDLMLKNDLGASGLPSLPPKRAFNNMDIDHLQRRQAGLEVYLRAVLERKDLMSSQIMVDFLEVPSVVPVNAGKYTSESWMEDYRNMDTLCRNLRGRAKEFSKKDEASVDPDENIGLKKDLATLNLRITELSDALSGYLGSSLPEGELLRRQNLMTTLRAERDSVGNIVNSRNNFASNTASRDSLGLQSGSSGRNGRVFGKETEQTKNLDNQGLVQLQRQIIDQQDKDLERISKVIQSQKNIGLAINDELVAQNNMLDDLTDDVSRTQARIKQVNKKIVKNFL